MLVRGNTLFVLDLGLDVVDCVAGLDFEGYGLAREGLDEAGEGVSDAVISAGWGKERAEGLRGGGEKGVGRGIWRGLHLHCGWERRSA